MTATDRIIDRVELFLDVDQKPRLRLVAGNNEIVFSGEAYTTVSVAKLVGRRVAEQLGVELVSLGAS